MDLVWSSILLANNNLIISLNEGQKHQPIGGDDAKIILYDSLKSQNRKLNARYYIIYKLVKVERQF